MSAKLKVTLTAAGIAVIGSAIAFPPALQYAVWSKWILYLVGVALMSPLFVAIWGGAGEGDPEAKMEIDPYSSVPLDLRLDNPYGPNGLMGGDDHH